MTDTRNKLMAWFLTLAMILTMIPVLALPAVAEGTPVHSGSTSGYTGADSLDDGSGDVLATPLLAEEVHGESGYATSVIVGGVKLTDGNYLANGATGATANKPEGGYAHYDAETGTLTLSDFVYEGSGYVYAEETDGEIYHEISSALIYAPASLKIRLVGENRLVNTILEEDFPERDANNIEIDPDGDGIYVESALAISGTGSLAVTVDNDGIYSIGGFTVSEAVSLTIEAGDDGIYSERHVTLSGTGSLTVVAGDDGIDVEDMDGQSSFTMTSGALIVDAIDHGLELSPDVDSTVACKGNISGGKITITTEEDEGIYVDGGSMVISGGEVYVNAADDGIDLNSLEVYDEETGDYKYYGGSLTITGGTVEVISVDYPITVQGDLTISGGFVLIESDSSPSVGGEVIIDEENATVVFVAPVFVAGVKLVEGEYLGNDGKIYSDAPEGGYAHLKDGVLTLSDFVYEGIGYQYDEYEYIYEDEDGEVSYYEANSASIYTVAPLEIRLVGENRLVDTLSEEDFADKSVDELYVYGCGICADSDLTISGTGSLALVTGGDGIMAYGDLSISGTGSMTIEADDDGIESYGNLSISGTGSVTVAADDDGIDSYGELTISAGKLNVYAGDWGIYTCGNLTIEGGDVNILTLYEGIWVSNSENYDEELGEWISLPSHVTISGGNVEIQSGSACIYVCEGDVTVSGGNVEMQSDSACIYVYEGDMTVSGGSMDILALEPFFVAGELTLEDYVIFEQRDEDLWVVRLNINLGALDFELDEIVYNGEAQTPAFTLTVGDNILVEGVDFTVTYANNVNTGTATMIVKGIGGCEGEKTAAFEILPRAVDLIWSNTNLEYNGNRQVPTVTAVGLLEGDECFITVSGNGKYEGTFTATATLSNPNYVIAGNDTVEYSIWADPYKVVGGLIPDSVKTAVSEAVSDMVADMVTEMSNALAEALEDTVRGLFDQFRAGLADKWNQMAD